MRKHLMTAALAALALAAAGCGTSPALLAAGARPMGFQAQDAGWSDPIPLADMTDAVDIQYDRPDGNNPFADPIDCYSESKPTPQGTLPAIELVARASDKPRRGFGLLGVDSGTGSFQLDDKGALAPHVRLAFQWGDNTASMVAGTSIEAMMIVVVQQKLNGTNTVDRALGYAWTNTLPIGQVFPAIAPVKQPALRINYNGEEIPLRLITLETGDGLGQPCGDQAFQAMPLKTENIADFVHDFYTAYPNKFDDLDASTPTAASAGGDSSNAPPFALRRVQDVAAAPPVPSSNQDLLGITAVGFGADVAPSSCSHAVFTNLTMQRQLHP